MNETAKEFQDEKLGTPQSDKTEGTAGAKAAAAAGTPGEPTVEEKILAEPNEDVAGLVQRLTTAEAEIEDLRDKYARSLAEAENVRRRAARDRAEASKYAISAFARDMLSVADNLRRAIESVDAEARSRDSVLDALVGGIEMTERELLAVFERYGITPIAAEGERFDPHIHEAMFQIPNESIPNGTVMQVVQQGYKIHDRTLRPARVGVSKDGPKPGFEAEQGAEVTSEVEEAEPYVRQGSASAYEKQAEPRVDTSGSRVDEKL